MNRPLHRLLRRLARAEDGIALVLALGALVALGTLSASALAFSQQGYSSSRHAKADQTALALAEAGLNNALATLHAAPDARATNAVAPASQQYEGGRAEWWGELNGATWTLFGRGVVPNPSGATRDVVRKVSTRVSLGTGRRTTPSNAVWNYLFADNTATCTSFSNSVVVDVPVYVRGNLCMSNTAKMTGFALRVGGTVSLSQSASIGEAGTPIREAHIAGGCRLDGGLLASPCGSGQHVYATTSDTSASSLTKPAVDLPYWYANAVPGPRRGCTVGSFPGGFDNDGAMNRSLPAVDLAPTTPYDCRVYDSAGYLVGQLTWTPGRPGRLQIRGTIFFDGDIVFRQQTELVYEGRATIYTSGRLTFENRTVVCGLPGCPDSWNPNQSLMAFVAGSSTDQYGVTIGNFSRVQTALYAVGDFSGGNNSITWGPIIADEIHLQNSILSEYVPLDAIMDGMPATYDEFTTVSLVPGSWG